MYLKKFICVSWRFFLKIWEIQGLENDAREASLPEAQNESLNFVGKSALFSSIASDS